MKDIINYVKGTVVECNTAYPGARNSTEKHKKLLEYHEWSKYFNVDILDMEFAGNNVNIRKGSCTLYVAIWRLSK